VNYQSLKTHDNDYEDRIKQLVDLVNEDIPLPNAACEKANKFNPHYCMMVEHLRDFIKSPIFVTQSLYDSW
jgi:hypothetical protein